MFNSILLFLGVSLSTVFNNISDIRRFKRKMLLKLLNTAKCYLIIVFKVISVNYH